MAWAAAARGWRGGSSSGESGRPLRSRTPPSELAFAVTVRHQSPWLYTHGPQVSGYLIAPGVLGQIERRPPPIDLHRIPVRSALDQELDDAQMAVVSGR